MESQWSACDVMVNGLRFHYHRTGAGKPPVVLLHGATDNGLCWARVAQALQSEYDLIMIDARGHGLSDASETGYSADGQAADVAGLVKALHLDQPVLVGHSMGAATAATAAARYPGLARAIVLEDPPWRDKAWGNAGAQAEHAQLWRSNLLEYKAKSTDELAAICRAANPTWDDLDIIPWAESKKQFSASLDSFFTNLGGLTQWRDVVSAITCPVLLIVADPAAGAIVTPQLACEAASLWRRGRVVHIPGAGHNVRREQFEAYMAAVAGFLKEVHKA